MAIKKQELVYARLKDTYSTIVDANKSLGDRATTLVAGGTAIATLFGAGSMFSDKSGSLFFVIVSAVASLFVFVAASFVWAPFTTATPGSLKVENLWDSIIDQPEEIAIANMINDLIGACEIEKKCNAWRAMAFRLMLIGVWVQVIAVFLAMWFGK